MLKKKYIELVEAYKDDYDIINIIQNDMMAIFGYVNKVYNMEIELPIFRREYDGEVLRRKTAELDKTRHDAHERAIIAVKRLNRYAEKKDLEHIFEGNADDRLQVAEFCQTAVDEFFNNRIM